MYSERARAVRVLCNGDKNAGEGREDSGIRSVRAWMDLVLYIRVLPKNNCMDCGHFRWEYRIRCEDHYNHNIMWDFLETKKIVQILQTTCGKCAWKYNRIRHYLPEVRCISNDSQKIWLAIRTTLMCVWGPGY